ncbi:hypothetical protein SAY87_015778 [Trapa incisa]|uniref:Uncharacterized protein n=1 Tax=Trapa incisa TaxID=236973 RepID=A0AAN7QUX1_9MYRT|nr:hypothetical protein SAY87_015778 [Trapa incisa]
MEREELLQMMKPLRLMLLLPLFLLSFPWFSSSSRPHPLGIRQSITERRALLSFKDTPKGSNISFDCSPSGACVPCLYSEKKLGKYRCSETGYRIPLRCVEVTDGSKVKSDKGRSALDLLQDKAGPLLQTGEETISVTHRTLLEELSSVDDGLQSYITHRSCIPASNVEKLSVVSFEGIIFFMLFASSAFIYFRKKQSITTMPGVGMARIPTNARF